MDALISGGLVPAPKSSNGHPRSTIFAREKTSFEGTRQPSVAFAQSVG